MLQVNRLRVFPATAKSAKLNKGLLESNPSQRSGRNEVRRIKVVNQEDAAWERSRVGHGGESLQGQGGDVTLQSAS